MLLSNPSRCNPSSISATSDSGCSTSISLLARSAIRAAATSRRRGFRSNVSTSAAARLIPR